MLLRVRIGNFTSYRKVQEFTMFPNKDIANLADHIFDSNTIPILKMGVLYGNNASGKSNFVKALRFIRSFAISLEDFKSSDVWSQLYRLAPNEEVKNSSLSILVEFKVSSSYYTYEIELDMDGVRLEQLSKTSLSDFSREPIFTRRYSTVKLSDRLSSKSLSQWSHTKDVVKRGLTGEDNKYRSLLGLLNEFPILEEKDVLEAFQWFREKLVVVSKGRVYNEINALLHLSPSLMDFSSKFIQGVNMGIDALRLDVSNLDTWLRKHTDIASNISLRELSNPSEVHSLVYNNERPVFNRVKENGVEKILELFFSHIGEDGKVYDLGVQDESDGTIRTLHLIPTIHYALANSGIVIIDEIDTSLHSNLLLDIVAFFSHSKSEGQLLFTSHDTSLLDSIGVLRADEVWFVEKKHGASYLYSLDSYISDMNGRVSQQYREGRFGANYSGNLGELNNETR